MKKIIIKCVFWVLILLVLLNTIISYLSYNRVIKNKEPIFSFESKKEKNKIIYKQGLYNVIVNNSSDKKEVSLKLFVIK